MKRIANSSKLWYYKEYEKQNVAIQGFLVVATKYTLGCAIFIGNKPESW